MPDTWDTLMWLPGTLLGVAVGILGAFVGVQASRGKLRPSTLRLMLAALAASAVLILAGVVTLAAGQPRGVWYGLLLPGLIVSVSIGANLPMVVRRLREQSSADR